MGFDINKAVYGRKYRLAENLEENGIGSLGCGCNSTFDNRITDSFPPIVALDCTRPLRNNILKARFIESIEHGIQSEHSSESTRFLRLIRSNETMIASYTNTTRRAIIVPTGDNYYFASIEQSGSIIGSPFLFRLDQNGNQSTATYYTLGLFELGWLRVQQGVIIDFSFGSEEGGGNQRAFWNNWTNCVTANINRFTDGSTFGAVMGLGCIAFGPSCAAGISIGCALQS